MGILPVRSLNSQRPILHHIDWTVPLHRRSIFANLVHEIFGGRTGTFQKYLIQKYFPLQILLKPTSFRRVFDLVHHYPISMPPPPPPLSIPNNQTNLIPCLLAATGARVRVGAIFDLIVERIILIVNLIGTTLKNDIRNL